MVLGKQTYPQVNIACSSLQHQSTVEANGDEVQNITS